MDNIGKYNYYIFKMLKNTSKPHKYNMFMKHLLRKQENNFNNFVETFFAGHEKFNNKKL